MRVIALQDLEREIDQRKKELGIVGNSYVPLNSGRRRTPEKRAMLQRLRDLAEEDGGQPPFEANF